MNCFDYFFENTQASQKDLIYGEQGSTSYQSIHTRAKKLAGYLNEKIGKGQHVLLVSQNNLFFVLAYLGILKSGNICIPLNPETEQNNLDFIIEKTGSRLGFFSDFALSKLKIPIDVVAESALPELLAGQPLPGDPDEEFDGEQVAEIIFTSGSTATPKGVMLSHHNIIANTDSIIQYLELTEKDRVFVVLPFFYCYGQSLLHTHLRVGGQMLFNNNFIFLGSTIKKLADSQCTGFAGVPSHFQILLRKTDLFRNSEFPYLRYVTQAGGKLHNTFIEEFIKAFPRIKFFVMYGQTEATARLSYLPPEMLGKKMGSLGKGIPGVELRVADQNGDPVSPGETGEIIARGKNVMSGYFDDKEETGIALRNGWLHTGDLAITDEDGYIYLTAREKEIIKVGGKRVSPKEIEAVIAMLPGVIDCSVVAVEDELLAEGIKATLTVAEDSENLSEEFIRNFCATKLAKYKIPTVIDIKKNISLSATGKKI
ncbi:MAG TPA: AMP-binding protein [Ferruginibacter sp.]|nr:AMP-binding protein [Ferruginibacter sp.]